MKRVMSNGDWTLFCPNEAPGLVDAYGENYTQNEWRLKLHSKQVKIKTTLKTSEDLNYTRNE